MIIVKFICHLCRQTFEVVVDAADYEAYQSGRGNIADIFPYLSADQRELFITSICGTCFDAVMADDGE